MHKTQTHGSANYRHSSDARPPNAPAETLNAERIERVQSYLYAVFMGVCISLITLQFFG
ncbi:hypothetical protein [Sulfitobacter sp. SK011]|uniref:hypothetical protein n=1 Tax=Sulfitobacter sp. SK011 TaxID=1389004 RepID=UPI0013B36DEE|nr:hypothetical protein [Sulfitobacter sp. SK011]